MSWRTKLAVNALAAAALLTLSNLDVQAVADGCAVVSRTPDGFLAVRTGPGVSHSMIARLPTGTIVLTDHVSDGPYAGPWWRISAVMDGIGQAERPLKGWIHSGFVVPVSC